MKAMLFAFVATMLMTGAMLLAITMVANAHPEHVPHCHCGRS